MAKRYSKYHFFASVDSVIYFLVTPVGWLCCTLTFRNNLFLWVTSNCVLSVHVAIYQWLKPVRIIRDIQIAAAKSIPETMMERAARRERIGGGVCGQYMIVRTSNAQRV